MNTITKIKDAFDKIPDAILSRDLLVLLHAHVRLPDEQRIFAARTCCALSGAKLDEAIQALALKILAVRRMRADFVDAKDALYTAAMAHFATVDAYLEWEKEEKDKTPLSAMDSAKLLVFNFCRETYQGQKDNTFASAVRNIKKEGDGANRLGFAPLIAEIKEIAAAWSKEMEPAEVPPPPPPPPQTPAPADTAGEPAAATPDVEEEDPRIFNFYGFQIGHTEKYK